MSERLTDAAIRNYIALGATAEVCLERTIAEECLARGSEAEGLRAEVERLTRERDEANAVLADAAAAFSAGDMERVRLDLCDRYARTRAATLNRQRDAEVARLRAAAIPEDAEEIVFKELSIGVFEPQDLEIQEAIHAKRRAKARAVVKALRGQA